MTFKEANDFIAKWRPILCSEWEIAVVKGYSPDLPVVAHSAAVEPAPGGYLRAILYLGDCVGEGDPRRQKRILLHELLHLTLDDLESAAKEAANGLGHDGQHLANETIDRYLERTVDRIADALAEFA